MKYAGTCCKTLIKCVVYSQNILIKCAGVAKKTLIKRDGAFFLRYNDR